MTGSTSAAYTTIVVVILTTMLSTFSLDEILAQSDNATLEEVTGSMIGSWPVLGGAPLWASVTTLSHAVEEHRVYAFVRSGIYTWTLFTENGGDTWMHYNQPIKALGLDPDRPALATESTSHNEDLVAVRMLSLGVCISGDAGKSWELLLSDTEGTFVAWSNTHMIWKDRASNYELYSLQKKSKVADIPRAHHWLLEDSIIVLYTYEAGGMLIYSTDCGATFDTNTLDTPIQDLDNLRLWQGKLIDLRDSLIWASSSFGATWEVVDVPIASNAKVNWFAVDAGHIYGTRNDTLFRYADGLINRFPLNGIVPYGPPVTVRGRLLVPYAGGILRYTQNDPSKWEQALFFSSWPMLLCPQKDGIFAFWGEGLSHLDSEDLKYSVRASRPNESETLGFLVLDEKNHLLLYQQDSIFLSSDGGLTWDPPMIANWSSGSPEVYLKEQQALAWGDLNRLIQTQNTVWSREPVVIERSFDFGMSWARDTISSGSNVMSLLTRGPMNHEKDLYHLEIFSDESRSMRISRSTDDGMSWQEIAELSLDSVNMVNLEQTGSQPGVQFPNGMTTRGPDHALVRYNQTHWIVFSESGAKIVGLLSSRYLIYDMTLHNGIYYASVSDRPNLTTPPSYHPGRILWRDTGSNEWNYFDLVPEYPKTEAWTMSGVWSVVGRQFVSIGSYLYIKGWRISGQAPRHVDRYRLTVEGGYGSGWYAEGDTVYILAAPLAKDEVFEEWSASSTEDVGLISQPREWRTRILMPARDINVTGSVGSLERPYLKNERIQLAGRDSIVMVSASAQGEETKGIILVYGDAEDGFRFYDRLDGDRFVRDAVAAGYTVASVVSDAYDHPGDTVAWNVDFSNRESNLDLLRTKKAIAKLLLREGASDLPVYLLGIGGAGTFVALLAREERTPAVAYVAASVERSAYAYLESPVILLEQGLLPSTYHRGATTNLSEFYAYHLWRGRDAQFRHFYIIPPDASLFIQLDEVDSSLSVAISREMGRFLAMNRIAGLSRSYRHEIRDRYEDFVLESTLPTLRSLSAELQAKIFDLTVASTAHWDFVSNENEAIIDFFREHSELSEPSSVNEPSGVLPWMLDLSSGE